MEKRFSITAVSLISLFLFAELDVVVPLDCDVSLGNINLKTEMIPQFMQ